MLASIRRGAGLVLALVLALALALAVAPAKAQQAPGLQIPRIEIPGASPAPAPKPAPGLQIPSVEIPATTPAPGTFEVRDVAFGAADALSVRIGRMRFTGLVRGADIVTAESALLEGLVARVAARRIEIPALRVTGLALPADAFRALTEGGVGPDWDRLAAAAGAAEIAIDAITDAAAPGATTTYTQFLLAGLKVGRIEAIRLGSSHGQRGEGDERVRFASDEIRYHGIDLAEIVRFFTGGGSGGAKRLVEQAVISGWSLAAVDIAIRADKLELHALDGRAPATSLAGTAAPAAAGPPRIVLPGKDDAEAGRRAAAYARDALAHLRVGRAALSGVSLASPDLGIFEIAAIELSELTRDGFALLDFKGLEVSAPAGGAKLGRFALEKFAFGGIIDWGLDLLASGREPELDPDRLSRLAPRLGAIRLQRLEAETPVGLFGLAEARFEVDNPDAALPERMTFALDGISLDLRQGSDGEGREQLMALGYRQLTASFNMLVRWAPNERALAFDDTRLTVEQLGRIDLGLRFANVDLDPAKPEKAEEAMGRAHIEQATARLTDLGLAERLFDQMSRGIGLSPDAVRAGLAAETRAQAEALLGPALAPGSGEAIEAFIRRPKSIAARAAFKPGVTPVTLAELEQMPPAELLARLTITIETPKD